jgi:uncharacterized protein (TIGR03437 family)
MRPILLACLLITISAAVFGQTAPARTSRITNKIDPGKTAAIPGQVHNLARAEFDRGAVDRSMLMEHMLLMVKPSDAQQAELDQLLTDQQNPSSPAYHQWLSPEAYRDRFGLNGSDLSKVVGWLASEGFAVNEAARGGNWIAFSGSTGQVSRSLHTEIHRFQVDNETHFANVTDPAVPESLAGVVSGFIGLNDFRLKSMAKLVSPDFNSGTSHYLAPADFATIYNLGPLYQAGIDGTGQSIVIVGESDVLVSDLRAFRTRYGLPPNDPAMLLYGGSDPGFNGAQLEGNLDLEWAGAVAPNAKITYVYGANALTAIVSAVNLNIAPIISVSYGGCEVRYQESYYRSIGQQANAQGITILAASGDSGAAACDPQGVAPFAAGGRTVNVPAVLPEVTAVGGTQFVEGTGSYWATSNSPAFGSALSYIPEAAWNESSDAIGLLATGGGASLYYPKPSWQTGPGVPNDGARHVPDVALSAALHDAYYIYYSGTNGGVAGTSASAPSMAGIVALLNQYVVGKGLQAKPGLGNINPQLYRLAQSAPAVFHDIVSFDNIIRCQQGSPDCLTGSFGYPAAPGYDQATGLGSVDANALVTQWNTQSQGVTVTVTATPARGTLNDTVQVTATVAAVSGTTIPTGSVQFSFNGVPLGSGTLAGVGGQSTTSVTFPLYQLLAIGTLTIFAEYSGDSTFSSGGGSAKIQIALPTGSAAILVSAPNTVWPNDFPDAQGLSWQTTITLSEVAGVPANVTGLTIDGQSQPLAQYFPSNEIRANGSLSATFVFRNLTPPVNRTFGFTGTDAAGQVWSRQVLVTYYPLPNYQNFRLTATPLVVTQNTSADPSCQWAVQLNVDDLGGTNTTMNYLAAGNVIRTSEITSIFGTGRNDAYGGHQGVLCFSGVTPQGSNVIEVDRTDGLAQEVLVSFAGPPANPTKLSAAPPTLSFATQGASQTAQATLAIGIADKTQTWTASIFPANRTTSWLTLSQASGTGPASIVLMANGAGFEPAAYRAMVTIQSPNAVPQVINVPVMFVLGGSASVTIGGIGNAANFQPAVSPGALAAIFGTNLANTTASFAATTSVPLPFTAGGVAVTVNGLNAPLLYISPNQINIQMPYRAGAGPAVLTVNNNGQIAGFQFQISPSAPALYLDATGSAIGSPTVVQGGTIAIYLNGAGDITPATKSGYPSSSSSVSGSPKPLLPLSVTVGGQQAFLTFVGIPAGLIGTMQVNFTLPLSVPPGVQDVVVTIGGASSPPAKLTVTAPPAK